MENYSCTNNFDILLMAKTITIMTQTGRKSGRDGERERQRKKRCNGPFCYEFNLKSQRHHIVVWLEPSTFLRSPINWLGLCARNTVNSVCLLLVNGLYDSCPAINALVAKWNCMYSRTYVWQIARYRLKQGSRRSLFSVNSHIFCHDCVAEAKKNL